MLLTSWQILTHLTASTVFPFRRKYGDRFTWNRLATIYSSQLSTVNGGSTRPPLHACDVCHVTTSRLEAAWQDMMWSSTAIKPTPTATELWWRVRGSPGAPKSMPLVKQTGFNDVATSRSLLQPTSLRGRGYIVVKIFDQMTSSTTLWGT